VCRQPIVLLGAYRILAILTIGEIIWKGSDPLLSSNTYSASLHWIMICDETVKKARLAFLKPISAVVSPFASKRSSIGD